MHWIRELFESSILRYIGVGGTAFIVDFGLTILARDMLKTPLWLAVSLGFWAGFLVNFTLQRNFSFRSDRSYAWSLVMYFLLVGFNWAATTFGMYVIVGWIGWSTAVGKIVCTAATTVWNYPIYRFIVFPRKGNEQIQAQSIPCPQRVDFVIPAHNSESVLEQTVNELRSWAQDSATHIRAIIVENGSIDGTMKVMEELQSCPDSPFFTLTISRSAKGLGNAYRHGIELSDAELVVLSADDLPFGTTDIDAWMKNPRSGLCIGSKAHPESQVDRGALRDFVSWGFRLLRGVLLRSHVGDPQGTLLADGDWLRLVGRQCREEGYLSSTEIVAIAEARGFPVTEIPVVLTARQTEHSTRIRLRDIYDMGTGLIRIRKNSKAVSESLSTP